MFKKEGKNPQLGSQKPNERKRKGGKEKTFFLTIPGGKKDMRVHKEKMK